jgi:hypothetical protein
MGTHSVQDFIHNGMADLFAANQIPITNQLKTANSTNLMVRELVNECTTTATTDLLSAITWMTVQPEINHSSVPH